MPYSAIVSMYLFRLGHIVVSVHLDGVSAAALCSVPARLVSHGNHRTVREPQRHRLYRPQVAGAVIDDTCPALDVFAPPLTVNVTSEVVMGARRCDTERERRQGNGSEHCKEETT